MTTPSEIKVPKWLRHIQENSWEGEILISGGAIFTLLQLSDFLLYAKVFLSENVPLAGVDEVLIFSMITVKWVTISFTLHLILRGYWLALACVSGAFPQGVNPERFKLVWKYRNVVENPTLSTQLIALDKTCGLVFYSAFAFSLAIAGISVTSGFSVALVTALPWLRWPLIILIIVFLVDLVSFGAFRRNQRIGKIYYPVYLFFNSITLLFIYRKSLQIIFTNVKKFPVVLYLTVFIGVSFFLSFLSLQKVFFLTSPFGRTFPATSTDSTEVASETFYLDKIADDDNIRWYAIESSLTDHDYLKIFIPYRASYDDGIDESGGGSFEKIVTVAVDGLPYKDLDWVMYRRPKADQHGIMTMIPIAELAKGKHLLAVQVSDDYFLSRPIVAMKVPFWKE